MCAVSKQTVEMEKNVTFMTMVPKKREVSELFPSGSPIYWRSIKAYLQATRFKITGPHGCSI